MSWARRVDGVDACWTVRVRWSHHDVLLDVPHANFLFSLSFSVDTRRASLLFWSVQMGRRLCAVGIGLCGHACRLLVGFFPLHTGSSVGSAGGEVCCHTFCLHVWRSWRVDASRHSRTAKVLRRVPASGRLRRCVVFRAFLACLGSWCGLELH